MKLSIIIPCFNEGKTVESVLDAVEAAQLPALWSKEIILVDDGSSLETINALRRIESRVSPPIMVYRSANGGKGAAVKEGLRRVTGDYVIIQDADQEYDPHDYKALLEPIIDGRADAALGSRILKKNNVPYNAAYFYGGLLVTKIFNVVFRTRLSDIATCYKVFHRSHIPALLRSSNDDFVFDAVDLTLEITRGHRVVEMPISYVARTKAAGKKLNWIHGIEIVLAIMLARLGIPVHLRARASKIVRFVVSGGTAALVHFSLLYVLTEFFSVWYLASSGVAFVIAFIVSFWMQKYWTFRSMDASKINKQLPQHLSVAVFNLFLNLALVYAFVEFFGIWYMLAQVITTILIAIESYFAFRWIFR
ncbi:MAG: Glycosyl transferase family 2 [Parcubacteria group bacterium GW2011_GWA2_51_10]|nr:MAG: Glycosyl transferase family 2 [Parcubacteria group bacterium GW2011_GWA2_51_10]